MSGFLSSVKDSARIFSSEPKLILPKLIVAAIFTVLMVLTTHYSNQALQTMDPGLLPVLGLLLVGALLASLVDILASAMYAFMVSDFRGHKGVSLVSSLKKSFGISARLIPPVLGIEVAFVALTSVAALFFMLLAPYGVFDVFSGGFYFLVTLAFVFLFYNLYPVLVFEKRSALDSIKRTISLSIKNKADISKATLFSVFLSLVSFALAYYLEISRLEQGSGVFWVAFIIVRILTAYVYSYVYVLNPVLYLGLSGVKK